MLLRRLRYMFTNKVIRGGFSAVRFVILIILIIICLSGAFSQRKAIVKSYNFLKTQGHNLSEEIATTINGDKDSKLEITDEGIYLKDHGKGNKIESDIEVKPEEEKDSIIDDIVEGNDED